jgi:hypothetical protein
MPWPVRAEVRMTSVLPPYSTGTRSCCESSPKILLMLTFGRSILLSATTIGTSAALAWAIASWVCGITPSSAATTSTTTSVTLAPRARMAVKASWPGVSTKVIFLPSRSTW